MSNGITKLPQMGNEPIKSYAPGSKERISLQAKLKELRSKEVDLPMIIGGKEVRTNKYCDIRPPHDHKHLLGRYHMGSKQNLQDAIDAAMAAKPAWENMPWESRAAIFLKAADLITKKYRDLMNAVTMLGQSKNAFQAEIDSACELSDFYRFNVKNMADIYAMQPASSDGVWNKTDWRPLEGFVFALTPFNFTAIAGNLPGAPAIMGNVCVWKPSRTAVYSAYTIMQILKEAGLPDGVINLVYCSGGDASDVIFKSKHFAGIHFTGSTGVFNTIWNNIATNISTYVSYPRIVGETGGKDYILADGTANPLQVATAIVRGAFEYQGQKCSAASRAYISSKIWPTVRKKVEEDLAKIKMGGVEDFTNFINAVIDEASFNNIVGYIEGAKSSKDAEVIIGGEYDKSVGYFIRPTVILAKDPRYVSMREEIFGPVITIYVYDDKDIDSLLDIMDETSVYALTGAIISADRSMIDKYSKRLRNTAGNFYINDKPTGAVVNQQPFGGARASGTNDKAGSFLNLLRWTSPQTIKETFIAAEEYMYPNFLADK
ncbi:MAG: L-glutamate gamma-semialdehyde dehydrogenase [Rikenellaceae bacterium]